MLPETTLSQESNLVKVSVMLTEAQVSMLHRRRLEAHSSLGNQVRADLAKLWRLEEETER